MGPSTPCLKFRVLPLLLLLLAMLPARLAALSPTDEAAMHAGLVLQRNDGNAGLDLIGTVASKDGYTADEWIEFYTRYYSTNLFYSGNRFGQYWTGGHYNGWASRENAFKQLLGYYAAATNRISQDYAQHPADLGSWLASLDNDTRYDRIWWNGMLWSLATNPPHPDRDLRPEIAAFLQQLRTQYPQWLAPDRYLDPSGQPYAAQFRAQHQLTVRDALQRLGVTRTEIADHLALTGIRRRIFVNHGQHLLDNQFLNARDLAAWEQVLDGLPLHLPITPLLMWNNQIGYSGGTMIPWAFDGIHNNMTDWHAGDQRDSYWMTDDSRHVSDAAVGHVAGEASHAWRQWLAANGQDEQQEALRISAGMDARNYVHSRRLIDEPDFVHLKYAFFYDLNRVCFNHTEAAFTAASRRFLREGRFQPLAQFLWWLDVWSGLGSTAQGFVLDERGTLSRYDIPLTRDGSGRIRTFRMQGTTWQVGYFTSTRPNSLVPLDAAAPLVTSVGELLGGTNLVVSFNGFVSPASATNLDNYSVDGVRPVSVSWQSDLRGVGLTFAPPLSGDVSVSVSNLQNLAGAPGGAPATFPVRSSSWQAVDLGPAERMQPPSQSAALGSDSVDVVAAGRTFHDSDDAHFVYRAASGDFDARVRLAEFSTPECYAQATLEARAAVTNWAWNLGVGAYPASARNLFYTMGRSQPGPGTGVWPSARYHEGGVGTNSMLRLVRVGNHFTGLASPDGTDWKVLGTWQVAFPSQIFLGLGTGAYNDGRSNTVTVRYRDFAQATPHPLVWLENPVLSHAILESGGEVARLRVRASAPVASALTVRLAVTGTATAGADFQMFPATVEIPAGAADTVIEVRLHNDAVIEGPETVQIAIAADASYEVVESPVALTVLDDENPVGGLVRSFYYDVGVSKLTNLTASPKFPGRPDSTDLLSTFEMPDGLIAFNHGTKVSGYLLPPATDEYRFIVAGADECELYLSTDESPSNARLIAREPQWSGVRQWHVRPNGEKGSDAIRLEGGKRYYIELRHIRGGLDHFGVTWHRSGEGAPGHGAEPIPGEFLSLRLEDLPPVLVQSATNQQVLPGATARFVVVADGAGSLTYQWQFNGEDISDATNAVLELPGVTADFLGVYRVKVGNQAGGLTSGPAVLSLGSPSRLPEEVWVSAFTEGRILRFDSLTKVYLGNVVSGIPGGLQNFEMAYDGLVYCASASSNAVYRVNPDSNEILGPFVPSRSGGLNNAIGLAWGPNGRLAVGSWGSSQIIQFAGGSGALDRIVASSGNPPGFVGGNDLTWEPDGTLFVSSYGDGTIKVFNPDGSFQRTTAPATDRGVANLTSFTRLPGGDFLVSAGVDGGAIHRINGTTGQYVGVFVPGRLGGMATPFGLRAGADGFLYVADGAKVLRFNATNGQFVDEFATVSSSGVGSFGWVRLYRPTATNDPVEIIQQPLDAIGSANQPTRLSVTARGSGKLHYQWQQDGRPLPSETNALLAIPLNSLAQVGGYDVVVSSPFNSVTSRVAQVGWRTNFVSFATNVMTVREVQGNLLIPLVRSGGTNGITARIGYSGTALTNVNGSNAFVNFNNGQTSAVILLRILDDAVVNAPRTLTLTITAGLTPDVEAGPISSLTLLIEDNDTEAGPGLGFDGRIRSILAMADGGVLVGGDFLSANGTPRRTVARLRKDFSLDPVFAPELTGWTSTFRLGQQPEGRVVVGGSSTTTSSSVRFLEPDGHSVRGYLQRVLQSNPGFFSTFDVDGDGRVALAGRLETGYGSLAAGTLGDRSRAVMRLLADGSRDPEFSAVSAVDPIPELGLALALLRDGSIVVGGSFNNSGTLTNRGRIAKYRADGTIDATWVTGVGFNGSVLCLAEDVDGRIYASGNFGLFGTNAVPGWARLESSGRIDSRFQPTTSGSNIISLALLPDGNFLGLRNSGLLEEYLPSGALVGILSSNATAFAVESTGFVVVGEGVSGAVRRLRPAGVPSTSQVGLVWGVRSVLESEERVRIPVRRTGPVDGEIEVRYRVTAGTAGAGVDFAVTNGFVRIASGQVESQIEVVLTAQNAVPNDDRTLHVELTEGAGATIDSGRSNCVVTIIDDDRGLQAEIFTWQNQSGVNLPASRPGVVPHTEPHPFSIFGQRLASGRAPLVHFEWGQDGPVEAPAEVFSVLWSGWIIPEASGEYQLATFSDDGSRIWLDGNLELRRWQYQSGSLSGTRSIPLVAGRPYRFVVHYFEGGTDAICRLLWRRVGAARYETIPSRVLRPAGFGPERPTLGIDWLPEAQSFQVSYLTEPGRPIHIERSTNSVDWTFQYEGNTESNGAPVLRMITDSTWATRFPAGSVFRARTFDGLVSDVTRPMPLVARIQQGGLGLAAGSTGRITLSALANGGTGHSFLWLKDGLEVRSGSTLVLGAEQSGVEGDYQAVVYRSLARATSAVHRVRLHRLPVIESPLKSQTWVVGSSHTLSAGMSGVDLRFQWHKDGFVVTGQTQSVYQVSVVSPVSAGTYWVVGSNAAGSVTNGPITIDVVEPIRFKDWQVQADGRLVLRVDGISTAPWILESSPDLVRWDVVENPESVSDGMGYVLAVTGTTREQFYRVRLR